MPAALTVVWTDRSGRDLADRLLREEVSHALGLPEHLVRPGRLCPSCGSAAHGRPVLAPLPGRSAPDVGVSRAGPVTVVALSTVGAVGVDVERSDAAGFEGFGAVALHPSEESASAQARTVTWVRKEALLKATGHGLLLDPAHVRISEPGAPPALLDWPGPGPAPRVWMYDVATAPGHVTTVAVLSPVRPPAPVIRREARAARSPRATS